MRKTRSPWISCAACALLMFCVVGLSASAFGVYQPYLISDIGLSNTQASFVVTARILSSIPAIFLVQRWLSRMGLRRGVSCACLFAGGGFFVLSCADSFIGCCLGACLHGVAYGLGGMIASSIIIKQVFTRHQALALGICASGTGLASFLVSPIITALVENISLRASFRAEGSFILFSALLIYFLLGAGPPLTAHEALPAVSRKAAFSPQEKKTFRFILPAVVCIGTMGVGGWTHLSVLYTTEGMPGQQVSWLISFAGLVLAAGQCLVGRLADRFGGRRAVLFCSVALVIGQSLACLASLRLYWVSGLSMLCFGLGIPLSVVGLSILAGDLVAPERYAAALRNFQLIYRIGSLVFEPVPGIIADATGSYVPAYGLLAGFALLSLLLILRAYRGQLHTDIV